MATFFFSLSLRASQQVLKIEDPLGCWIVKLLLLCEVASALLIVQLGVFTDPLYGLLAFLLLLLMGMWYSYRKEGKNLSGAYAYRMSVHTQHGVSSSFASELSVLEAHRNAQTLLLPVLLRASCTFILLISLNGIMGTGSLNIADASYACFRVAGTAENSLNASSGDSISSQSSVFISEFDNSSKRFSWDNPMVNKLTSSTKFAFQQTTLTILAGTFQWSLTSCAAKK